MSDCKQEGFTELRAKTELESGPEELTFIEKEVIPKK